MAMKAPNDYAHRRERKRKADRVGLDRPLPRKRHAPVWNEEVDILSEPRRRVALATGSVLALRFPHLVPHGTPTKGRVMEMGSSL